MSDTLPEGFQFGGYTVQGTIAGGGMGHVYAARHEVYANPVALKVLHEHLHADEDWRARFNEEGLVGTQLKHPHVLSARELVHNDGRIALVLDLVPGGQTLGEIVAREFRQGLSVVQALQVFLGIVQGIEYLHTKGIVHGDLKPENVMIEGDRRNPSSWVPKVTDFGTVALIANPVMLDGRPAVVATPRYASPEHLLGVDQLEVRSDIYSLGLILHFLVTGRHASNAQNVREAYERTLKRVPIVALVDQPEALIATFQRSVAIDPGERFESCRDLALAVRAMLDEHGVKLDLDDLAADLATEVDEDRARQQQQAHAREAEQSAAEASDAETELDEARMPLPDPDPAADDAAEPAAPVAEQETAVKPDVAAEKKAAAADTQVTGISSASQGAQGGVEAGGVPIAAWVGGAIAVMILIIVAVYGWAG